MAPRTSSPASRQNGGRLNAARALLASIAGNVQLVGRDGTSGGLRIAMIVTPTILAILVFALLAYFGYNYWQKRRPRSTSISRPRGGVSPFTLSGHRRNVDLVAELPTMAHGGAASEDLARRPSARVREHGHRLVSDEKLVLEEMRKIEDKRAMWNRDRDRDRNRSDSKPKGSGSTVPYDARHDPFEFLDRQRKSGREGEPRDKKTAPLTTANISAATQTGGGVFVLDLTSPTVASPTLVSPTSPGARGRRTKGPPTPIDVVVSQSFPVTTPALVPLSSTNGTAQIAPFTPLPGYPVSAGFANPLEQLRDVKVADFKNALDSPTSPLPGQTFAAQNQARTPANARRGEASARAKNKAKLKLQVVNAAIKKSRHRKSSSTVDTGTGTSVSVSSPPKPDTAKEPPFYSRPPSYVMGHGRTFSDDIGSGQSVNVSMAMASPTSVQGSTFRDSGLFPAGMSTGDAQSTYGGRRSFSSSRYSQDVQAVAGPSSRPMSPYSPIVGEHGVPPVPAMPPSAFNFALSASAAGNRASGSSRRSRKAVPSKSTPSSAPASAYPPESATSSLPSPRTTAETRFSSSSVLSSSIAVAPARPERSAARLSRGDILVISSSDVPPPPSAAAQHLSTSSEDEDERGAPAIPPLPFESGGFGFGMGLSGEFGTHVLGGAMHDDPEADDHDVQSAGGHSVSNSLSGLLDRQASLGSSSPGPAKVVFPAPSRAFTIARSDSLPSLASPASATKSNNAPVPPMPTRQVFHRTASSPALNDDGASMQDAGTFGPVSHRLSIVRRKPVPSDASLGTAYTLGSGSDLGLATHAAEPGMRGRFDSIDFAPSVASSLGTRA